MDENSYVKMEDVVISDKFPYIVSLDDLDCTLLGSHLRQREHETGAWSSERLKGDKKYYQVEISSRDDADVSFVSTDNFTCHICDIDVPLAYAEQHKRSDKHETYERLFAILLTRASQHMLSNKDNSKHIIPERTHYCETCCKFIHTKNKRQHLRSNYHNKTKKNDDKVKDLLNSFEKTDDSSEKHDEENLDDKNITNNGEITTIKELIEAKDFSDQSTDTEWTYSDDDNDLATDSESDDTNDADLQKYLKQYAAKNELPIKLPVVENYAVIVENNKEELIKIALDNYLSFKNISDKAYCQMCKTTVTDNRTHNMDDGHIKNILRPINHNFMREIDESFSHCLVCNEIVLTISDHSTLNENHTNMLANIKVKDCGNDKLKHAFYKIYPERRNGDESPVGTPFYELGKIIQSVFSTYSSILNNNWYSQGSISPAQARPFGTPLHPQGPPTTQQFNHPIDSLGQPTAPLTRLQMFPNGPFNPNGFPLMNPNIPAMFPHVPQGNFQQVTPIGWPGFPFIGPFGMMGPNGLPTINHNIPPRMQLNTPSVNQPMVSPTVINTRFPINPNFPGLQLNPNTAKQTISPTAIQPIGPPSKEKSRQSVDRPTNTLFKEDSTFPLLPRNNTEDAKVMKPEESDKISKGTISYASILRTSRRRNTSL